MTNLTDPVERLRLLREGERETAKPVEVDTHINKDGFTKRVLPTTNPSSPWYEYLPSTEQEFKEIMLAIVKAQLDRNRDLRILAMNEMIRRGSLPIDQLSQSANDEQLVDVYWTFYQHNLITIGYTESENIGMQVFSVSERERTNSYVH